jgi:hypothetical protein
MIDIKENSPRTTAILTNSRITLDSIKNVKNHSYLTEEIRKRLLKLQTGQLLSHGSRPTQGYTGMNWPISWQKLRSGPETRQSPTTEYH